MGTSSKNGGLMRFFRKNPAQIAVLKVGRKWANDRFFRDFHLYKLKKPLQFLTIFKKTRAKPTFKMVNWALILTFTHKKKSPSFSRALENSLIFS